jgi:hypothetical protein
VPGDAGDDAGVDDDHRHVLKATADPADRCGGVAVDRRVDREGAVADVSAVADDGER